MLTSQQGNDTHDQEKVLIRDLPYSGVTKSKFSEPGLIFKKSI